MRRPPGAAIPSTSRMSSAAPQPLRPKPRAAPTTAWSMQRGIASRSPDAHTSTGRHPRSPKPRIVQSSSGWRCLTTSGSPSITTRSRRRPGLGVAGGERRPARGPREQLVDARRDRAGHEGGDHVRQHGPHRRPSPLQRACSPGRRLQVTCRAGARGCSHRRTRGAPDDHHDHHHRPGGARRLRRALRHRPRRRGPRRDRRGRRQARPLRGAGRRRPVDPGGAAAGHGLRRALPARVAERAGRQRVRPLRPRHRALLARRRPAALPGRPRATPASWPAG